MSDVRIAELFHTVARMSHRRDVARKGSPIYGSGQYRCLLTIEGLGEVSQRRLAAVLGIRAASLSELLGKMIARGWVRRTPHPQDGRTYLIALTEEGHAEAIRVRSMDGGSAHELLEALSDDQRRQFAEILEAIRDHYMQLRGEEA
ncbi:MarR family [Bifidobacterium margollesii]|uniref:MarR family n=1 Tax=Bifidobacterium margollesii TaxID=2020964 RepID=A0A2N5JB44_9BIFI|nr:MarR family winged helix-turn-helix transcriptional regulator [Bifidobacterium margollesii]PLS31433.1 MarR family [Bifidobacterium margollesii]